MSIKYRPDIDGLRAIAVLAVIVNHLNYSWLHGGYIGVDIFFVISGFLITKIIYSDMLVQRFSFKAFYQRRINRILPVFFIVMFSTFFAAWYVLFPDEFMLFLRSLKTTTYFWQNMFFSKHTGGYWDTAAAEMPLLHTWSLAVEEQFYVIFPLILILILGCRFKNQQRLFKINYKTLLVILTLIALASFTLAQLSPFSAYLTKYNYYALFTGRAGELLIGSIIGIMSFHHSAKNNENEINARWNNPLSILGLLGIIISMILMSNDILFPSFWTLIPTISAACILYFYHPATYVAKFLSLKPLVFIGKISYSLYLWHWPVFVLARKYLWIENFTSATQYIVVMLISFVLSITTYYLIEQPARKHKRSFKFSLVVYYLIPTLMIFSVYYTQKNTHFMDSIKYGKERLELYHLQKQYLNPASHICHNKIIGDCIFGDLSKQPKILLFGDSQAGHYTPFLDEAGKKYGFSFRQISCNACLFIPKQMEESREKYLYLISQLEQYLSESDIVFYAIRGNAKSYQSYISQIPAYLKNIKKTEKTVIFIGQIPIIIKEKYDEFLRCFLDQCMQHQYYDWFTTKKDEIPVEESNHNLEKALLGIAQYYYPLDDLNPSSQSEWPLYHQLIAYKDPTHFNEYVTRQWAQEVLPKEKSFWEKIAKAANK